MRTQQRRAANPIAASIGFAPVAGESARILILGSLPGQVSLQRGEYYAQPQNVFWRVMGALFGAGPNLAYTERTRRLVELDVAVWDVCASAQRAGSLDASIEPKSVMANDFAAFYAAHPHVELIGLNGAAAATLYERHVVSRLIALYSGIRRERLPSTSPAHASRSYEAKLAAWKAFVQLAKSS